MNNLYLKTKSFSYLSFWSILTILMLFTVVFKNLLTGAIIMLLWYQIKNSNLSLKKNMNIDIQRLQCINSTETGQIQKVCCYLPFGLLLSVFGLKTKDLYHLILPGGWNCSQDLNALFEQAFHQKR